MIEIVGIIAAVVTLALVGIGITLQVGKNFQNKSTRGISFPFFVLSFMTWGAWSVYGWLLGDTLMGVAQGIGALMTLIILFQFFLYRERP